MIRRLLARLSPRPADVAAAGEAVAAEEAADELALDSEGAPPRDGAASLMEAAGPVVDAIPATSENGGSAADAPSMLTDEQREGM